MLEIFVQKKSNHAPAAPASTRKSAWAGMWRRTKSLFAPNRLRDFSACGEQIVASLYNA
jgi:hypothetical protein